MKVYMYKFLVLALGSIGAHHNLPVKRSSSRANLRERFALIWNLNDRVRALSLLINNSRLARVGAAAVAPPFWVHAPPWVRQRRLLGRAFSRGLRRAPLTGLRGSKIDFPSQSFDRARAAVHISCGRFIFIKAAAVASAAHRAPP